MRFWNSTIGKKIVVALTGLIMFVFVIGHLLGNLQVFLGARAFNEYADFLHNGTHGLLWVARAVLLVSIVLHIVATVQLTRRNRASRSIPYAQHTTIQATTPSLFMIWSGVFLGLYILYHLTHLTFGWTLPGFNHRNVYANVALGFPWPVALLYVLGMVALGFHLHHGISSMFQTLGLNHPKYNRLRRGFAVGASIAIAGGYSLIPLSVLVRIIRL